MNEKPTQAPPPQSAAERRIQTARATALAQLPDRLRTVEQLVAALGGKAKITADRKGRTRTIVTDKATTVFGPDPATLARGTVFQRPAQAAMAVAIREATTEARILDALTAAVPTSRRDHVVLKAATRELLSDMWLLADDEEQATSYTGRRVPLTMRPALSKIVARAHEQGDEAARRTRQAIAVMPALVNFVPADELIRRAAAGDSVTAIARAFGGSAELTDVRSHALPLITADTVRTVSTIMEAIRDVHAPRAKQKEWSSWMREMIRWSAFGEVAPGFLVWLIRGTYGALDRRSPARNDELLELTLWVDASHGKRGGWNDKRGFSRAMLEAAAWADGTATEAKRRKLDAITARFNDTRPASATETRYVRPLRTPAELLGAGTLLNNCLARFPQQFAADVAAGRSVILGTYAVKATTNKATGVTSMTEGTLRSAAEVRLDANGKSLGIRQHTSWGNASPSKVDRDAVRVWIEEQL